MLVLILGGQPPRGPELLGIQVQNTATAARGVLIEQGLVMLVTNYHKNYSIEGSCKLIHRYLPPTLGLTLIRYLVMVPPFVQQLCRLAQNRYVELVDLWGPTTSWKTSHITEF